MKANHISKKNKHDFAAIEIVSTILLLGFTVTFFASITYFFLSSPQSSFAPITTINARISDNNIILEHRGGVAIDLNATIALMFNDTQVRLHAYDYVDTQAKQDGQWGFGEKVVYPIYRYHDYVYLQHIDIMIVNDDTGSSIMYASIQVQPTSDLRIDVTVDQQFPTIGSPILIIITIENNGNLNASGIQVRFKLPPGLQFSGYNATNGSYDNDTGIWENIGVIQPVQTAQLIVTAVVEKIVPTDFTQLLILQDGSGSIRKSDWDSAINGYVSALSNESVFPRNEMVELTFVQFGGNAGKLSAQVDISPTLITNETISSVTANVINISQMVGLTSTACGFLLGADTVTASSFFQPDNRHVVLLITDGKASAICNPDGDYMSDPPAGTDALTSAVQARNYLINAFQMNPLYDEIDVMAVHVTDSDAYLWFKDDMVWPQPGYFAPPFRTNIPKQGFVSNVSSWEEFPISLKNILVNILNGIRITGDIVQTNFNDPRIADNIDSILIIPQISQ